MQSCSGWLWPRTVNGLDLERVDIKHRSHYYVYLNRKRRIIIIYELFKLKQILNKSDLSVVD